MIPLNISGGFYESDSLPISAQQCTNWYVNIPQTEGALTPGNLFGTAGLNQIASSGTSQNVNRGSHVKAGLPYFLNGTTLYRLDRSVVLGEDVFTLVGLGTIPGTERASFADNGTELLIIAGGLGWIMDESVGPTITAIVAAGFTANGTPEQANYVDSFFVVTTDTKKFIRSDANDGLTWNSLNNFTAEADPDPIVAPIVFKNELYIGGSETIEPFRDNEGVFQRIDGFIINKGVFAPFGIVNTSDTFMFVGGAVNESPAIWGFTGNTVEKVSTTAIDSILARLTTEDIQSAFAYSYAQAGAYFVGFTFPNNTFEFNTVTGKWNERESQITDARGGVSTERFRINSLVTAYNKVLCGDSIDGRIGEMDIDTYTEYGTEIVRTFATAPFSNQGTAFAIPKLEATMESGVGDAIDDPQLRLSVSKNAKTFNNELSRGFGKVGQFNSRAIWRKLGRFSRLTVLKFVLSDAVKPVFIKLEANIKGGRA